VWNDHPWGPKIVAIVDMWLLFRDHLALNTKIRMVVVKKGGRYSYVVVNSVLTVLQINGSTQEGKIRFKLVLVFPTKKISPSCCQKWRLFLNCFTSRHIEKKSASSVSKDVTL
jgi:hypothetical protein